METKVWPAQITSSNDFLSVLSKTPALLLALTSNQHEIDQITPQHSHLSPLKTLRLVCRAGRVEASRAITHLSFKMTREPSLNLSGVVQLLDGSCLQIFGIRIFDTMLSHFVGGQAVAPKGEQGTLPFWIYISSLCSDFLRIYLMGKNPKPKPNRSYQEKAEAGQGIHYNSSQVVVGFLCFYDCV